MSLSIELWSEGRIVEGAEEWWDFVESALPQDHATRFPLLSRIDPYDDATFVRSELEPLAREIAELSNLVQHRITREFLQRLIALCERGNVTHDAELRFIGD